jgi:hypothetical protein
VKRTYETSIPGCENVRSTISRIFDEGELPPYLETTNHICDDCINFYLCKRHKPVGIRVTVSVERVR